MLVLVFLLVTAAALPESISVEAESFVSQERTTVRKWEKKSGLGASGGVYLQALPDTRLTHDDKLISGENFSDKPGLMAVVSYRVKFPKAGRYYIWVRAYSSGPEDNSIHVGLNGEWPASGQRMQWCEGKSKWTWASKQRTAANHCGEPGKIWLDVPSEGEHTIQFSMREDGFRFDRFILTTDPESKPPEQ